MSQNKFEQELAKLRKKYGIALPGRIAEINQQWQEMNVAQWDPEIGSTLQRLCHSLAGSAATFGFPQVSEQAKIIENLLLQSTLSHPIKPALYRNIEAAIQALLSIPLTMIDNKLAQQTHFKPIVPLFKRPIFILDDEPEFSQQLKLKLRQYDFEVVVFHSAQAMLQALATAEPGIILMDMMLTENDQSGTQVIQHIRNRQLSRSQVIFISAGEDLKSRLAAVRAGGDAYFVKPCDTDELVETINLLVGNKNPEPFRILLVDDDVLLAQHYCQILNSVDLQAKALSDPLNIMQALVEHRPDVLLLDLHMPGCNGLELAKVLRQHDAYRNLPIVFLSSETDLNQQFKAREVGGDDFLLKPIDDKHLITSVVKRAQRARLSASIGYTDSMTGLLTHAKLKQELDRQLQICERQQRPLSFVMLDLDHFKKVNDNYGHLAGDAVIKEIARLLKSRLRVGDLIGRYGGEEFAIIMPDTLAEDAYQVLDSLRQQFEVCSFSHRQETFHVTCSAGIAAFPQYSVCLEIVDAADKALYTAKQNGRNQIALSKDS